MNSHGDNGFMTKTQFDSFSVKAVQEGQTEVLADQAAYKNFTTYSIQFVHP